MALYSGTSNQVETSRVSGSDDINTESALLLLPVIFHSPPSKPYSVPRVYQRLKKDKFASCTREASSSG